jgi:hypothetical protein
VSSIGSREIIPFPIPSLLICPRYILTFPICSFSTRAIDIRSFPSRLSRI